MVCSASLASGPGQCTGAVVEQHGETHIARRGDIDRTIYHGAYPDGTAIRFESFQLWSA